MITFSEWLNQVDGQTIGAGQCWDLAQDCVTKIYGPYALVTGPSPHQGYAIGVWDGYGQNGVEKFFDQKKATATAMAGWIAIWKWGNPETPLSHIAPVIADVGLGVLCESQNPGPAHRMTISKLGLAGYLAPRNGSTNTATLAGDILPGIPDWFTKGVAGAATAPDAAQAIVDQLKAVVGFVSQVNSAEAFISNAGNWKRLGLYALGGFLLISVLLYTFKDDVMSTIESVTK